ncbi:MAG: hypothetical protein MI866_03920 [Bacteroidales bacterium]|nr:hypothetical protein [Bacteroidales bacterium]
MTVIIDGIDYNYDKSIVDVMSFAKDSSNFESIDSAKKQSDADSKNRNVSEIFKFYWSKLKEYSSVDLEDYYKINAFQQNFFKIYSAYVLDAKGKDLFNKIYYWSPDYILLESIPQIIPDKDEIELKLKIKEGGKDELTKELGRYKTFGGHTVTLSPTLFVTGLVNQKIYTDSTIVMTSDTTDVKELRAFIEDKNLEVGFGGNVEIGFRTWPSIRPTINIGMFVPFNEDITPYLAIGPGLSLVLRDVKLSLSGGFTGGFVNSINPKYEGKDLSKYPDYGTDLYKKKLKGSWHVAFGISFNVN